MHILITGGTGLLGRPLTNSLISNGHQVSHLSRESGSDPQVKTFLWDVEKQKIDADCINGIDMIVHLAGAGIAEKRWTQKRKNFIIESRTASIRLIYALLKDRPHQVCKVISASGVGYYGDKGEVLLNEESGPGSDFPALCCIEWEKAVDEAKALNIPVLKFRTGVILTEKGGALPELAGPIKSGIGAPLGSGKQWIPWIHIDDAISMYLHGIQNRDCIGTYNMAAPHPVSNEEMTKAIARHFHKKLWLPNIPAFALKIIMGEMCTIVLSSTKAASSKIENTGFQFKYSDLELALKAIYNFA
jgi:uncharacterized protein (TIGR01777 family)